MCRRKKNMIFDKFRYRIDIVFKRPRTSDRMKRPGYSDNKKKQELLQFVDQYCRGEQYHRNINFYPEQDLLYLSSETNDSITNNNILTPNPSAFAPYPQCYLLSDLKAANTLSQVFGFIR